MPGTHAHEPSAAPAVSPTQPPTSDRRWRHTAFVAVMAEGHGRGRQPIALANLNGQPVYLWALQTLHALSPETRLTLLAPASHAARVARPMAAGAALALHVVPVAEDRALAYLEALRVALADLPAVVTLVGLHDVTVPTAAASLWTQALAEVGADERTAVAAAHDVSDTIKLAGDDGSVYATPPRAELRALQTPLLVPRAALDRALSQTSAEAIAWAEAPAGEWLTLFVARLLADDGLRLRLIPAGPNSLPLRARADLSLAARWLSDTLGAPA